jgi:hypothetical protein
MSRLVGVLLAVVVMASSASAGAFERVPAVFHVHSDLTTGVYPLAELARMAEQQGIQALLLAENYLLRVEYGLPPFRALTRVAVEERGVLDYGLDRYLARVAEVQREHPRVMLIPGVEVVPHYYWRVSPLDLTLTLHNTQKNLLVFGVTDPAALATLPAVGNPPPSRYTAQSLLDALPGMLVIPGLALVARKWRVRRRLERGVVVFRRRRWLAGAILASVGVLALVRSWPFTIDRYPPWQDFGIDPYQALIDHVDRLGGATLWSFPEAPDMGERSMGPVTVAWRTEPHPSDLLRTSRYVGFGGLYEQAVHVVEPGAVWDRLLGQFAAGERSRPAWALGESGYHGPVGGKRLGSVQTVFLVAERTPAAILAALRSGRLYAVQRAEAASLVLGEYVVVTPETVGVSGDRIAVAAGTQYEVRVAVEATGPTSLPLRVTLIRNGEIADAWSGQTPFRTVHRTVAGTGAAVFRLDVRSAAPHRLLSSPIFVISR